MPKLPDWAVLDVLTADDTLWPRKVVAADFFDERRGVQEPPRKP